MVLTHWISRLVPPSAKDRYIASLEAQLTFNQQLLERITSSLLQGLHMPGIAPVEKQEMPNLRRRMTPSQWRRAAEAADRKSSPQPGEKENHGHAEN